jgi:hypothetical protein
MTKLKITVDGHSWTPLLEDSATARDLVAQLPMTLTLRDFNGVEKAAPLPRPLTTAGAPAGASPVTGDLGYYAPLGNLVLYYTDVGYWDGIVRLGHLDTDIELIEALPDDSTLTVEVA